MVARVSPTKSDATPGFREVMISRPEGAQEGLRTASGPKIINVTLSGEPSKLLFPAKAGADCEGTLIPALKRWATLKCRYADEIEAH